MLLPKSRLVELAHIHLQFIALAVLQQLLPGYLAALQPGHAAQHAAQRRLYAFRSLIVELARDNAFDEALVLLAIRKGQIVAECAVRRKLRRTLLRLRRVAPRPTV